MKKCKREQNLFKKNNLLDACLNKNGDLFNEIKKLRNKNIKTAKVIDGVKVDIPNHFSSIYEKLYNSVKDEEDIKLITDEVRNNITPSDINEVMRINGEVIKKAIAKIKSGKGDPVFD